MNEPKDCKKYVNDNICSMAYPYITYCDVNRKNKQCPEGFKC